MTEAIKDLKGYLGINKSNPYGLLVLGSIIEFKIPVLKKATKSNKNRRVQPVQDRRRVGRGEGILGANNVIDHLVPRITEEDIAEYLEEWEEEPRTIEAQPQGFNPAFNDVADYIKQYTFTTTSTSPNLNEITEDEYNKLQSELNYTRTKLGKLNGDPSASLSRIVDLQMVVSKLQAQLNNSKVISFKENTTLDKVQLVKDFINLTGKNPAIIKAYIADKKLITSNTNLQLSVQQHRDVKNGRAHYLLKVFYVEDNKIKFKYHRATTLICDTLKPQVIMDIMPSITKAKIKDFKSSSEIFGLENKKSELVGDYIDNWKIYYGSSKNLGGSTFYLALNPGKAQMKFVLQDIEFIDPELKGYTLPKDNSIFVGDTVKILDHKVSNYINNRVEPIGQIISYKRNQSSKRIKGTDSRRKDHVTIRLSNQSIITVYAEDLKKVENVSKIKEDYLF